MIQIDEPLPDDPLASEAVLHLRLHLKRAIRSRTPEAPEALAMLFGFARSEGAASEWMDASASPVPLMAGAEVAARRRGSHDGVVALGHDVSHLAECKAWLLERKQGDDTFEKLQATDLATLLELSKARDLAVAMGKDEAGQDRPLPILIEGDTGTGKELLAEAIHKLWKKTQDKPDAPFVVAQVAGLPRDLAIDELFGHVKGAYTNAVKERDGLIHIAEGGTLLIDEVGDLPPEAQVRLLRFLQTRQTSRTGEDTEKLVQVRVLAATWRDLPQMVAQGAFRKDLYHRLCYGTSLKLPPLKNREGLFEEVVPEILTRRGHRAQPLLARNAKEALKIHDWPGNLRELVGVLEEASSLAQGSTIRLEHLPTHLQRRYLQLPLPGRAPGYLAEEIDSQELTEEHARWRVERLERQLAAYMPEEDAGIAKVAQILATLPGSLPEHEETVQAVSKWSEVERLARRHEALAQYWRSLIGTELPSPSFGSYRRENQRTSSCRPS